MTTEKPDTSATPPADPKLVEEAKTEAGEIQAEITETKQEAADARKEGDDARADRLEERITALDTKLDKVVQGLEGLAARPFHPAPEIDPPTQVEVPPQTGEQSPDTPPEDAPKPGRTMSKRFFGARAGS